jgi:hypothetical protein
MPLSLNKLQNFLAEKGFIPIRYYIMDGMVFFIELFSAKTSDLFLLYIPSKYEFTVSGEERGIFKLRYINMASADNRADEYAGAVDAEEVYGNMQVGGISPGHDDMENQLESRYKKDISLKDISNEDAKDIKAIFRQVRRLRFCVQNLKYKLAVQYKNYLCAVRRDDSVECYDIKYGQRLETKKLYIIVDLETLYDRGEKLFEDLNAVRQGVYSILEKNQASHIDTFHRIMHNKKDILQIPSLAEAKKNIYEELAVKTEQMFADITAAERKIIEELCELDNSGHTGLHTDINIAHNRTKLQQELDKIATIKKEIAKTLGYLREKRENSILSIDKINFDNAIMFDCMIKNFAKLKDFC